MDIGRVACSVVCTSPNGVSPATSLFFSNPSSTNGHRLASLNEPELEDAQDDDSGVEDDTTGDVMGDEASEPGRQPHGATRWCNVCGIPTSTSVRARSSSSLSMLGSIMETCGRANSCGWEDTAKVVGRGVEMVSSNTST